MVWYRSAAWACACMHVVWWLGWVEFARALNCCYSRRPFVHAMVPHFYIMWDGQHSWEYTRSKKKSPRTVANTAGTATIMPLKSRKQAKLLSLLLCALSLTARAVELGGKTCSIQEKRGNSAKKVEVILHTVV